ncbi:MAG TPA: hypothetical protein VII85_10445 [Candidatus Krumholzibacteriaceae bacterium]
MRPSSASVRCALSVALLALVSCAHPKVVSVQEPLVTLQGVVALASASPLETTIVLTDVGGRVCTLTSPSLEYELRSLAGQGVRVTGRLLGKTANGPEFLVEGYEMMPVKGERPVIGVLAPSGGGLILTGTRSGAAYRLAGPLAEALRGYSGFKVWISGRATPAGAGGGGETTLTVESYGILVPAAGAMDRTP